MRLIFADVAPTPSFPPFSDNPTWFAVEIGVILLGAAMAAGVIWLLVRSLRPPRDSQQIPPAKSDS